VDGNVKVRVRLGAAEAEVESDPEHLAEAIGLIPEIIKKLSVDAVETREREPRAERTPQLEFEARGGQQALPTVIIEKSDSLSEVIGKFFGDPWGRDSRKLSDVREALQSYGLNYPKQSVAVALLRLAKTSKIRRFKAPDGEFVYTASNAFISQVQQEAEATVSAAG